MKLALLNRALEQAEGTGEQPQELALKLHLPREGA